MITFICFRRDSSRVQFVGCRPAAVGGAHWSQRTNHANRVRKACPQMEEMGAIAMEVGRWGSLQMENEASILCKANALEQMEWAGVRQRPGTRHSLYVDSQSFSKDTVCMCSWGSGTLQQSQVPMKQTKSHHKWCAMKWKSWLYGVQQNLMPFQTIVRYSYKLFWNDWQMPNWRKSFNAKSKLPKPVKNWSKFFNTKTESALYSKSLQRKIHDLKRLEDVFKKFCSFEIKIRRLFESKEDVM